METYSSPTGIQTFQNNLGLILYVVPPTSYRAAILENRTKFKESEY